MEIPGVHANDGLPLKIQLKRSSSKSIESIGRHDSGYVGPSNVTSPVMESAPVRKSGRPELSYAELITEALAESPHGLLSLQEIYESIRRRYLFFKTADAAWQNSIRHNLSVNATFLKVPRPPNRPGKGSLWATTRVPHRDPEQVFGQDDPMATYPKRFSRKSDSETVKIVRPKEARKTKKRVKRQRKSRGDDDESESFESDYSSEEVEVPAKRSSRQSPSPETVPRKRGRPPAQPAPLVQPVQTDQMPVTESETETEDDSLIRAPRLPPLEPTRKHTVPVTSFTLPGMPPMTVPKRIHGLGITSKNVPWDDYEPDLPTLRYRPIAPPMVPHTATPAAFGTRPGAASMTPFLTIPGEGRSLNPSPIPFAYSLSRATSPCSFFVGSQYGSFLPQATPQGLGLHSPNSSPLHGTFAPTSPVSPHIGPRPAHSPS